MQGKTLGSTVWLLRLDNLFAPRTFGPNTCFAALLGVLNKEPRFWYLLTALRTAAEGRFVGVHTKGWKACDSVPSTRQSVALKSKPLAGSRPVDTEFLVDTTHQ